MARSKRMTEDWQQGRIWITSCYMFFNSIPGISVCFKLNLWKMSDIYDRNSSSQNKISGMK